MIRSAAGAKTETAAMAQWMIGETYFHQKNYEAALREYLRLEILYAYPDLAGGGLVAGRQVPRTAGRGQGGRQALPEDSEDLIPTRPLPRMPPSELARLEATTSRH